MKQQLKGEISISTVHITRSDKLILNLTRNPRNEIVTKENMNKTNTQITLPTILLVLVFKDPHIA